MLRTRSISSNKRKVNICAICSRKLMLCFFSRFFKSLKGHLIFSKIDTVRFLKFISKKVNDCFIKVFTTKECITVSCFNFENTITCNFKNRDIKSTTTKVKYCDILIYFTIKTVSKSSGCWLIYNTLNFKTCNTTSIFCCLSLSIVEISRNCNNCVSYFFTKIVFS